MLVLDFIFPSLLLLSILHLLVLDILVLDFLFPSLLVLGILHLLVLDILVLDFLFPSLLVLGILDFFFLDILVLDILILAMLVLDFLFPSLLVLGTLQLSSSTHLRTPCHHSLDVGRSRGSDRLHLQQFACTFHELILLAMLVLDFLFPSLLVLDLLDLLLLLDILVLDILVLDILVLDLLDLLLVLDILVLDILVLHLLVFDILVLDFRFSNLLVLGTLLLSSSTHLRHPCHHSLRVFWSSGRLHPQCLQHFACIFQQLNLLRMKLIFVRLYNLSHWGTHVVSLGVSIHVTHQYPIEGT
jgi:hypothetical protein